MFSSRLCGCPALLATVALFQDWIFFTMRCFSRLCYFFTIALFLLWVIIITLFFTIELFFKVELSRLLCFLRLYFFRDCINTITLFSVVTYNGIVATHSFFHVPQFFLNILKKEGFPWTDFIFSLEFCFQFYAFAVLSSR